MPRPNGRRLTLAYKAQLTKVRATTGEAAASAFARLGSWDQADVARFTAQAAIISRAGQSRGVALTDAYLALFLSHALEEPIRPAGVTPVARPGVDPADVYQRPFVQMWGQLSRSVPFQTALVSAVARVRQAADTDVQLAARNASNEILGSQERVVGWQRVNGNACDLCEPMCLDVYSVSDLLPIHPGCGCVAEPVTEDVSVRSTEGGAGDVAVHEHGELGPILGFADDEFTTADEI